MKRQVVPVSAVFLAAVAIASCSKPSPNGIAINGAFKPLISPETTLMAGIDVEALKSSTLYSKYKNDLNFPGTDEILHDFGVDLRRDLAQALYVANEKTQYVLARGTFRGTDVEGKLRSKGLKPTRYKGFTLWGDTRNSLALLKGPVALMGPIDGVQAAINTEDEGHGEVPEQVADRLRSMPKGDQVWFVSRKGLPFTSAATRTDLQSALSNFVGFVAEAEGSVGIGTGVHLQSDLFCSSAEGATRVNDALRGTIAIARLSTKDTETSLLKVYDAAHIERQENVVHVRAELTGEQVDELVRHFVRR